MQQDFYTDNIQTPIGILEVTAVDDALVSIFFVDKAQAIRANAITQLAVSQLQEYFDGELLSFSLPLTTSGSEFQQQVWQALTTIEYGDTCSYADIANKINNPKGVRAVGLANSKNPMTIVVPCHRVIGKNGTLTGYAGGVDKKAWLLKHEGALLI